MCEFAALFMTLSGGLHLLHQESNIRLKTLLLQGSIPANFLHSDVFCLLSHGVAPLLNWEQWPQFFFKNILAANFSFLKYPLNPLSALVLLNKCTTLHIKIFAKLFHLQTRVSRTGIVVLFVFSECFYLFGVCSVFSRKVWFRCVCFFCFVPRPVCNHYVSTSSKYVHLCYLLNDWRHIYFHGYRLNR